MIRSIALNLLYLILVFFSGCNPGAVDSDTILENKYRSFNLNWKFRIDSVNSYESPGFDDSGWKEVDLPHDWSIERQNEISGKYNIGIFSKESAGGESTGHVLGGIGWYRKSFFVDPTDSGKIFNINFDGVYMLSDVFVNGNLVGSHFNGYTPFSYNITDHIKIGEENIIAVKVKNLGENSRWYSGSGIYRDVTLIVTEPIYLGENDVFVTTPEVSEEIATVDLALRVRNESEANHTVTISLKITNPAGELVRENEVEQTLRKGMNQIEDVQFSINSPSLWSSESPELYSLKVAVYSDNQKKDEYEVQFGIRSIAYGAEKGFLLNGKPILLKGGNIHHDNGLLGSKTFYRAEERKIEILKANGYNAIRTSHNPPSKNMLDVCDRLGMLVMDEAFDAWERAKKAQDYSVHFKENWKQDLEDIIYRDRNHPSVVMWSIGNEINERADTSGIRIAKQLTETIKAIDTTRPITAGVCGFWDHPGREWETVHDAFKYLDIAGYNYKDEFYVIDHEKYPERVIAGTEAVPSAVYKNWEYVKSLPYVIGDYVWTAVDYIGESGIGHINYADESYLLMPWPWYNAWCGDIDLIGDKKPQSYYRDVVWGLSKLEMAVSPEFSKEKRGTPSYWGYPNEYQSWTWPDKEEAKLLVTVYSSCENVKLELNGKLIDEKVISDTSQLVVFEVPYEPGELKAIGLTNGNVVVEKVLQTTDEPKELKLEVDKKTIGASRDEIAFVTISLVDSEGNLVINDDAEIKIAVTGSGELIASGNGAPNDMESFNNPKFKTFQGRALAIVRALNEAGEINISVESVGLPKAEISVSLE